MSHLSSDEGFPLTVMIEDFASCQIVCMGRDSSLQIEGYVHGLEIFDGVLPVSDEISLFRGMVDFAQKEIFPIDPDRGERTQFSGTFQKHDPFAPGFQLQIG